MIRKLVKRAECNVRFAGASGGVKLAGLIGDRRQPLFNGRFIPHQNRLTGRSGSAAPPWTARCSSEIGGENDRAVHQRHAVGVVRQRLFAKSLW